MSLRELLLSPAPEIERVALAIGADAYPTVDPQIYTGQLDRWGWTLKPAVDKVISLDERVGLVVDFVYGTMGLRSSRGDYYDPRDSYLNEVMERRIGNSISLTTILLAVGRRVAVPLQGIAFPGHSFVRVGKTAGWYLDPVDGGRTLGREDVEAIATDSAGVQLELSAEYLEPASARQLALHMLRTLQRAYELRGDHSRALVVCNRLVELTTTAYHHRDRGLHALALGAYRLAVPDFEAYLVAEPDAADAKRIRALLRQAVAGLKGNRPN